MTSAVIKNWDNKTWLSSKEYIKSFNSFITNQIKLNKNSRILDIGCGRGKIIGNLGSKIGDLPSIICLHFLMSTSIPIVEYLFADKTLASDNPTNPNPIIPTFMF